ncbi:alpha/beta hydrolase [Erythrobacter sp. SCSIO 43205]|uniref:alpha/beta hydrolase n=1 Tax=Erythrobacter sp. SCSIO 43205 TaxID=2779361 RepID=UPI001CA7EACF|nr:alpha/beta hydrolase [Erythrobacter sp. SCSIO 43205]UAB78204.1 alpha/beta hydrolase [Erythrobacter sp. SCSIO 43205]
MKNFAALNCAALFVLALLALFPASLAAQGYSSARVVETQSWVEEWDPATGRWVRVDEDANASHNANLPTVVTTIIDGREVTETRNAARYALPVPSHRPRRALAQYGPFQVTSENVAIMVGPTNWQSPRDFDAMMRDFPGIQTLEMIEAPGTSNDIANLEVGRKIRARGISTHVPSDGSVRSGAVELFLAGATRTIDDGATFAVHAWLDNHGREASDFAPGHPAHRLYLDYYVAMGFTQEQAQRFYAMTNSVPHADALWLTSDEMRGWVAPDLLEGRFAARQMLAECVICASVEANLAVTQSLIDNAALDAPFIAAVQPRIGYGDMSGLALTAL